MSIFGYFRTSIALKIWLLNNAAAQVALVRTTTMNEPAIPTGDVSQSSANPLAPGALRQLFFSPAAYFRSMSLDEGPAWLVVAWISGVSSVIDRVDQRLLRADLKGGSSGTGAIEESWYAFWVLALGAPRSQKHNGRGLA